MDKSTPTLSPKMVKRLAAIAKGAGYAASVRDRTFDALTKRGLLVVHPSLDARGTASLTDEGRAALALAKETT